MIPITVKEAVETSTAKSICYLRFNVKGAGLWEFAVFSCTFWVAV